LHPHIHFLATEGGLAPAGVFHEIPRIDDARLAEIFAREVLSFLVGREILSPEWAERLISWLHAGFNVHSRVGTETKIEAGLSIICSCLLLRRGPRHLRLPSRNVSGPPIPLAEYFP
jgi:hypothetical protein